MSLQSYKLAFLNWFYPQKCLSCQRDLPFDNLKHLCQNCWESIRPILEPYCSRCGIHLPDGGKHCFHCKKGEFYFSSIRCAGVFEGALRDLIHQFKYGGKDYLDQDLSQFLWRAWNQYPELHESEMVIPVPLYFQTFRERGYNQAQILAEKFVVQVNTIFSQGPIGPHPKLCLLNKSLVRLKKRVSQTQLSREERMKNILSSFQVSDREPLRSKNVLLIDDVCTSTSTLNECAKVLKKAGAKKVFGLALARD